MCVAYLKHEQKLCFHRRQIHRNYPVSSILGQKAASTHSQCVTTQSFGLDVQEKGTDEALICLCKVKNTFPAILCRLIHWGRGSVEVPAVFFFFFFQRVGGYK